MQIITVKFTKEEFRQILKFSAKNNLSTNEAIIKLIERGLYLHRILKCIKSQEGTPNKRQNLDDLNEMS